VAAARLAPDVFPGLAFHALCRAFPVDQAALEHISLLDVDMLVVRQHRAGRKPHQRGHQAGRTIEQQRLGLAAGEAGLLPLHISRANNVGMRFCALGTLRRHGVHGDAPVAMIFFGIIAASQGSVSRLNLCDLAQAFIDHEASRDRELA
jgi:hypothetical protein